MVGGEVRTRDIAPSYKDPTVLESHCLPLDRAPGKNKSTYWRAVRKGGVKKKSHKMAGMGFGAARVP